ncbi:chaperonin 10-like protein [Penicillium waksmanii]|uniref:chaperonin 10-like protein n=1 Tax=Penicillium waksmanii TaxID=69791 RepID=UPI002548F2F8|nr:chaperonin 10-like protein [Penicillium waksmanii]KAJ6001021.1 chaperonin 10-like protein [Penicillium waksmanii]
MRINDITGGLGAHAVIVAVGASQAYKMAVKLLRPLGTLICVGLPELGLHIPMSAVDCVNRGYKICWKCSGNRERYGRAAANGR